MCENTIFSCCHIFRFSKVDTINLFLLIISGNFSEQITDTMVEKRQRKHSKDNTAIMGMPEKVPKGLAINF